MASFSYMSTREISVKYQTVECRCEGCKHDFDDNNSQKSTLFITVIPCPIRNGGILPLSNKSSNHSMNTYQ